MSKFQAGDRVRVYENAESILTGTVADLGGGKVRVLIEPHGASWVFHPKQCRKLVKKERRRVWIACRDSGLSVFGGKLVNPAGIFRSPSPEFVEFVEVRRKAK